MDQSDISLHDVGSTRSPSEKALNAVPKKEQELAQEHAQVTAPIVGSDTKVTTRRKVGIALGNKKKKKHNRKKTKAAEDGSESEEAGDGDDENDNSDDVNADFDDENSEIDDTAYLMPLNLQQFNPASSVSAPSRTGPRTNNQTGRRIKNDDGKGNAVEDNNIDSDYSYDDSSSNRYFLSEPSVSEAEDSSKRVEARHKFPPNHRFVSSDRDNRNNRITTSTDADLRRSRFQHSRSGCEPESPAQLTRTRSGELERPRNTQRHLRTATGYHAPTPIMSPSGNTSLSSWDSPAARGAQKGNSAWLPGHSNVVVQFEIPQIKRNKSKNSNQPYRSQPERGDALAQSTLNQYGNSQKQSDLQQQQEQEQQYHPRRQRQNQQQSPFPYQLRLPAPPPLPQQQQTTAVSADAAGSLFPAAETKVEKSRRKNKIASSLISLFKPKTNSPTTAKSNNCNQTGQDVQQQQQQDGNHDIGAEYQVENEEIYGPVNSADSVNMTFSDTEVGITEDDSDTLYHHTTQNANVFPSSNSVPHNDISDNGNANDGIDDSFFLSSSLDTKHQHAGLADDERSSGTKPQGSDHINLIRSKANSKVELPSGLTQTIPSSQPTAPVASISNVKDDYNTRQTFSKPPRTHSGGLSNLIQPTQQHQAPQQQLYWNQNQQHPAYMYSNYQQQQQAQQIYLQHQYYQHQQLQHQQQQIDHDSYASWLQQMSALHSSAQQLQLSNSSNSQGSFKLQQQQTMADDSNNVDQNDKERHLFTSNDENEYDDQENTDSGWGSDANSEVDEDNEELDEEQPMTVQQNRLLFQSCNTLTDLSEIESQFENKSFRGQNQNVMRPYHHRESIFANIDKRTSDKKLPRAAFVTNITNADPESKFPTYICPNCKTEQRMFFSADDAVTSGDVPGVYLAVYFTLYVVSSLFIFGLEEGWKPLDCIYFAAITLTTTGFGDFVPTTDANKITCSVFIYFGVACIGLLLGSYIAGMLDERAVAARRQRQIGSCPVCARIRTMRENAENKIQNESLRLCNTYTTNAGQQNGTATPFTSSSARPELRKVPRFYSARNVNQLSNGLRFSSAVYSPGSHHLRHHNHQSTIPEWKESSISQGKSGNESTSSSNSDERVESNTRARTPAIKFNNTSIKTSSSAASDNPGEIAQSLDSEVTHEILRRQVNTRHYSISTDISHSENSINSANNQTHREVSKRSTPNAFHIKTNHSRSKSCIKEENNSLSWPKTQGTPPTITESKPFYSEHPLPAPTTLKPKVAAIFEEPPPTTDEDSSSGDSRSAGRYRDFEDEGSICSDSSTSTQYLTDERKVKLQTAKYVFITLRTALVNSLVIIAVGCIGFWLIEGFSLVDSWYFTTVLLTTVGYGDITPVTHGGKLFATVYLLVAGTILLNNMSSISMIPLELRRLRIERAVLTQFGDQLDDAALRELATGPLIQRLHLSASRTDGLNECTREMFSLAMLVRLGKVNEEDIKQTFASFRRLDVNDEGVLNSKSIIAAMIKKTKQQRILQNATPVLPSVPPQPMIQLPFRQQPSPVQSNNMNQYQQDQNQQLQLNDAGTYWYGHQVPFHVDSSVAGSFPSHDTTARQAQQVSFDNERSALLQHQHFGSSF